MTLVLKNIDRGAWLKFFTHVIVVAILFVLPEFLFSYTHPHWKTTPQMTFCMYFKPAMFAVVFYINYFFIIPRTITMSRSKVLWFIGCNIIILIGVMLLLYLVQNMADESLQQLGYRGGKRRRHDNGWWFQFMRNASYWLRDAGMIVMSMALAVALKLGEKWAMISQRHQEMLASQRAEELESLKSQLNPHFLFNSLNTIYALIQVSPDEAQHAVHQLSTLLRYVLYENPRQVELSKEIDFARNYISLMEMRLGPGRVTYDFGEESAMPTMVPPLIFITLIENAFKHGNTGNRDHNIEISIHSLADGTVVCRTRNHFTARSKSGSQGEGGIGISNLRRRLHLIYGDDASLSISVNGDVYEATLTINPQTTNLPQS